MADKFTQQLADALAKAAAHPDGLPLYAGKSDPGLFPNTAAAKPAAQKCLTDGLVRTAGTDAKGRTPRELYTLTDAGWEFLLAQVNPKQVLEDFVRVLEARQGEVGELLGTARRMADSLQGLKDAVARVLPAVAAARVPRPNPPVPFPTRDGGVESPLPPRGRGLGEGSGLTPEPVPTAVAVVEPDLAAALLARLADWPGPTDCTLPELFRSLAAADPPPTIGEFHDCLRKLYADGVVSLPAWTGPLYAMPEPAYALLIGHGIAYYASLREAGVRRQESVKTRLHSTPPGLNPDSCLLTPEPEVQG